MRYGALAESCEVQGIALLVPANRAINNQGDGTLFDRSQFYYDEKTDTFRCPANQTLNGKQLQRRKRRVVYAGECQSMWRVCHEIELHQRAATDRKSPLHDGVLQPMQPRATPELMRLRRSTVEHPFASLKYRRFGQPRFLLRGLRGAQAEISLAAMVYNLAHPAKPGPRGWRFRFRVYFMSWCSRAHLSASPSSLNPSSICFIAATL